MALFGWKEEYSVGNAMLDSDHRILVSLLSQLHDATDTGQSRDVVTSVLNVLAEYAEHHFRREELVMGQIGYPDRPGHESMHRHLEAQLHSIRRRWQAGERQALDEDTLDFLKKWLTEHLLDADRAYRPWIEAAAGGENPSIAAVNGV